MTSQRPDKPSKFAQIATVIEGPTEYKSARLTNKQRKGTLLEEVFADDKIRYVTIYPLLVNLIVVK